MLIAITFLILYMPFVKKIKVTSVDLAILSLSLWWIGREIVFHNSSQPLHQVVFYVLLWLAVYLFVRSSSANRNFTGAITVIFLATALLQSILGLMQLPDKNNPSSLFPHTSGLKWTIDNYGPYILPFKGMTISLSGKNLQLYHEVIKNNENTDITMSKTGDFAINDSSIENYTFQNNYYFMMGDNRHNSFDSRYFGPVSESKIVGKASFILFSNSKNKKWYTRLLKKLK